MHLLRRIPLLLSLLLWLGIGCAARGPRGETVRSIHFRGNASGLVGTGDYQLRQAMVQQESPSFAWIAPSRRVALDRKAIDLDAWRLETWYAHHGFFDARFLAWDVVEVRPGSEARGPVVRLVGYVEPGPPSMVRDVRFEGMQVVGGALMRLLREQASLQPGDRFLLSNVEDTVTEATKRLQEQSYAYARVEPKVTAYPEEHVVDVVFQAEPGPSCVFGPVRVEGETRLSSQLVLDEITIEEGRPFQLSRIAETQQKLFGLGTFSVVNIVPELQTGADGEKVSVVPVRIELAESHFRQIKVGGGIAIEDARQEVHVSTEFSHVNLFNRLWRWEVGGQLGYASVAEWGQLGELGVGGVLSEGAPTAEVHTGLTIPRFPLPRWRWRNLVSFELGVEEEYRFANPEASTAFNWQMSRRWSSTYGYRVSYFDYFDSTLPAEQSLLDLRAGNLGLDFSDPYLLSMLFQQLKYDSRDDLLNPRRGSYVVLDLDEAGGPFGGPFSFVKALADGRVYRPVPTLFGWRPHATMTARLAGGFAVPYGGDSGVPFAERIFVGGGTSVRGWAADHLGPYIYPCTDEYTTEEAVCTSAVAQEQPYGPKDKTTDKLTYIGGRAALYGGVELRAYWLESYGVALFSDFGRAWDGAGVETFDELLARLSQMSATVGVGLRYVSPIGPIRLDVARRLDDHPMFSLERRWQFHFGLSEAW